MIEEYPVSAPFKIEKIIMAFGLELNINYLFPNNHPLVIGRGFVVLILGIVCIIPINRIVCKFTKHGCHKFIFSNSVSFHNFYLCSY